MLAWKLLLLLAVVCIYSVVCVDETIQEEERVITVEHSFNTMDFTQRSSFKMQSNGKFMPVDADKNGITEATVNSFKTLLSENGFYTIRINSKLGDLSSPFVTASVPACEIQRSGFKEDITLHLDASGNFIVGLSYSSPVIAISRSCAPEKITGPHSFLSRFKIAESYKSQSIPLQVLAPRPKHLENAKLGLEDESGNGKPAVQQSQSFLRQYWYLVLPLAIFMFMPTVDDKAAPKK